MSKRSFVLFILMFCICWISASDFKGKKEYSASNELARYIGRTYVEEDGSVSFDWSGTYVELEFTGGYLALEVSDTGKNFYNLFVDGSQTRVITTSGKKQPLVLAEGLSRTKHRVVLQKRTEGEQGITTIHRIITSPKGELFPTQKRERHIEFIGDSYTCGYGTESLSKSDPFKAETENCNLSYAPVIARYFNADYTLIAHSGQGVARNYGDSLRVSHYTMLHRFLQTFDTKKEVKWDFSKNIPDLVVIHLGTNDFSPKNPPLQHEFIGAYHQLILLVRASYGNVPILCIGSYMEGDLHAFLREYCNRSSDKNVYYTPLHRHVRISDDVDLGASWHPNFRGQRKTAMALIPYVASVMGWDLVSKVIE